MAKKYILIGLVGLTAAAGLVFVLNAKEFGASAENRRVILQTKETVAKCFGETHTWPNITNSDFDKMPEGIKEIGVRGKRASSTSDISSPPIEALSQLGFNALNSWGDSKKNQDESLSIYAKLATSKLSYDGREFQVRLPENTGVWINLRGKFEGSNFLRVEGNTLKSLKFLDGEVTFAELKLKLATTVAASMGTKDNDILYGRRDSTDVITGEQGCDTFLYSLKSGSDTIIFDAKSSDVDRVVFNFERSDVLERKNPRGNQYKGDQVIEFIETREKDGKSKKYLSIHQLTVFDRNSPDNGKVLGPLVLQYLGDNRFYENIHKASILEIPLSREDTAWIIRKCLGEPDETLGAASAEVNTAMFNHESNFIITTFLLNNDFDYFVFNDREIISRKEVEANYGFCPLSPPTKSN